MRRFSCSNRSIAAISSLILTADCFGISPLSRLALIMFSRSLIALRFSATAFIDANTSLITESFCATTRSSESLRFADEPFSGERPHEANSPKSNIKCKIFPITVKQFKSMSQAEAPDRRQNATRMPRPKSAAWKPVFPITFRFGL